jgi:hypothetical protein
MSFEEQPFEDDPDSERTGALQKANEHNRSLEKDLKKLRSELAEAQSFKAQVEKERTTKQVETLFQERGLNSSLAHLAVKDRPDAEWDLDGVTEWAAQYGLGEPIPPVEEPPPPETPAPVSTFVPTPTVAAPGNHSINYDEYMRMTTSGDPAQQQEAIRLSQAGLVDRS